VFIRGEIAFLLVNLEAYEFRKARELQAL